MLICLIRSCQKPVAYRLILFVSLHFWRKLFAHLTKLNDYCMQNHEAEMTLKKEKDQKLYYSISEVADMFHINESTLRFWEKEFDIINPRKTSKGTRFYKQEDIDHVRLIYHLVKERGLTLAGARQKLRDNREDTIRKEDIVNRLKHIKEELIHMRDGIVCDAEEPEEVEGNPTEVQ
jgi:DNA-binding transcriptional MerR regulator